MGRQIVHWFWSRKIITAFWCANKTKNRYEQQAIHICIYTILKTLQFIFELNDNQSCYIQISNWWRLSGIIELHRVKTNVKRVRKKLVDLHFYNVSV